MIELSILFAFLTLRFVWATLFGSDNNFYWDDLKSFLLTLTLTAFCLAVPLLMEPKMEMSKEYMSTNLYWSDYRPSVEFSSPVVIYEFKVDRPFTWLGDTKTYKIVIPQMK